MCSWFSMTEKKGEHTLKELLAKINHPLTDVRSRSLRSVVFKLNNNLLSVSDLIHEREFLTHLLEWFNFDEWVLESQVLSLIEQLAQYEPAAKTLVEIGGVEFLSQLRIHCDSILHPTIDQALDHMLKLPPSAISQSPVAASFTQSDYDSTQLMSSSATSVVHSAGLSQNSQTTFSFDSTTDFGSYPQISKESFGLHSTLMDSPSLSHALPLQYLQRVGTTATCPAGEESHRTTSGSMSSWTNQSLEGVDRNDVVVVGSTDMNFAYTASTVIPGPFSVLGEEGKPSDEADGGTSTNEGLFQWIRITVNDCHILNTTQSRVQNSTPDSLPRSCEFVQDVLFQDFPAELFLQRPALLNCLLKSLESSVTELSGCLPILNCLLKFTEQLKQRVVQRKIPSMAHTDTISGNDCLLGSGTGGDIAASNTHQKSHCDLETLTPEVLKQLQSEQLSVEDYIFSVITTISSLLSSCLHRDSPPQLQGARSDSGSSNLTISTTAKCLHLLKGLMELFELVGTKEMRDCESVQLLLKSVESLCLVISQCLSKWRRLASQSKQPSPQLQMVCCVCVCLAHCLSKILPLCESKQHTEMTEIPSLPGVLNGLMMNHMLFVTHPHLLASLLPSFQTIDAANSRVFQKLKDVVTSFEKMSQFLVHVSSSSSSKSVISLASEAMHGLWFVCNEKFISEALKVCFKVLLSGDKQTPVWSSAKTTMMKLLSHGSTAVKEKAYTQLQVLLNEHLTPMVHQNVAAETESNPPLDERILPVILDQDLMHLLCTDGTLSASETVSSISCHILADLLSPSKHQLPLELKDLLLQWTPFLEAAMSRSEQLCQAMQSWLTSTQQGVCLPELTRLQSCLRLLFSDSTQIRVWSYTQLSSLILSSHSDSFPFPTQSPIALHDVLVAGSMHKDLSLSRDGSFQLEDVTKLMHILRSSTLDISLKKSAMEQLSLVLQDHLLHEQALEEGICDHLISVLKPPHQQGEHDDSSLLIKPSIVCLLLLLSSNPDLRKKLCDDYELLMSLIKVAIQSHRDSESLHHLSKLLCLILFPSSRDKDGTILLPQPLLRSPKFPFLVKGYDLELSHEMKPSLDPNLFTCDPLLSMLRLQYNVALAGSVREVISLHDKQQGSHEVEEGRMRMLKSDVLGLKCLSVAAASRSCLTQLEGATSHCDVIDVLHLIEVVFSASNGQDCKLKDEEWQKALQRFLTVQPITSKDMDLLGSVLQFVSTTLLGGDTGSSNKTSLSSSQLEWLTETTCGRNAVCLKLLQTSIEEKQNSACYRLVQKTLLWFFAGLMEALALQSECSLSHVCDSVTLLQILQQCLDVAGSPSYYDLPLLECTLECLVHLTASKSLSYTPNIGLSMKLLSSLRQVIQSFVSGQGAIAASFMGKGVTSRASLCMCHLVQTASSLKPPEEWWLKWVQSSPDTEQLWLYCLIQDRDFKLRYAGFSLLTSLCFNLNVAVVILPDWESSSPFGLWGTCTDVFRDDKECGLVKQQALFLLVTLSALCNKHKKWSTLFIYKSNEMSSSGKDVLKYFLESYKFFPTLQSLIKTNHLPEVTKRVSLASSNEPPIPHISNDTPKESDKERPSGEMCAGVEESLALDHEVFAFCDPRVVSGACCLLHNLFLASSELIEIHTHDVNFVATLTRVLDPSLLQLIFENGARVSCCWVKMCVNVLTLLRTMVVLRPDTTLPHLLTQRVVGALCHQLSVVRGFQDKRTDALCMEMCLAVLSLLQSMATRVTVLKAELVFSSLQQHWSIFIGLLIDSLSLESATKRSTLGLFCSILRHRFHASKFEESPEDEAMREALKSTLDCENIPQNNMGKSEDHEQVEKNLPFGGAICSAFLRAYDQSTSFSEEKRLIGEALGLLLACSFSAKDTALEKGLLESSLHLMKTLHKKMCMENLEKPTKKKKDSPVLSELVSTITLLRNLMFKSSKVKSACVRCHLVEVIQDMWPSCTVNKKLLLAVLEMLTVLSAQHAEGRTSLAAASKGTTSLLQKILKLASETISSYNNCTAAKISNPHSEVLRALFTLLSNCALSQECRAIIKKTGFLSSFTTLCPTSEKPSSTRLSILWIKLLVNLSFSTEGQQMFFKQPGSLEVLIDVYQCVTGKAQMNCLMVLRNLCFYGPGKTLMASNEVFLAILSNALDSQHKQNAALAASAIWALLHNCVKIKNMLRKSELFGTLKTTASTLNQAASSASTNNIEDNRTARYNHAIIKAQEILSS